MTNLIVAICMQGAMGAGLGKVLTSHGADVITDLSGRSEVSRARAADAGMLGVSREAMVNSDFILSVMPPASALPFAQSIAPFLRAGIRKPVFVDCNAVSPETVRKIAAALSDTGVDFVDVGIIGPPPQNDVPGARLYAAGGGRVDLTPLRLHGLNVVELAGSIGTASALKMSYAGISKGLVAVASAMIVAADGAGVADTLKNELALSDPMLLASLARRLPDMLPKAYRWIAEMKEIESFLRATPAAAQIYAGASALYEQIAEDFDKGHASVRILENFFEDTGIEDKRAAVPYLNAIAERDIDPS